MDTLTDILALHHGFAPLLRIVGFEVKGWIKRPIARTLCGVLSPNV
jgi:hypothetical protein